MADQEAEQAGEEADTTATPEASSGESHAPAAGEVGEEPGSADSFEEQSSELTEEGGADPDAPIADINRDEVQAATQHIDSSNIEGDRQTLKNLQKEM